MPVTVWLAAPGPHAHSLTQLSDTHTHRLFHSHPRDTLPESKSCPRIPFFYSPIPYFARDTETRTCMCVHKYTVYSHVAYV